MLRVKTPRTEVLEKLSKCRYWKWVRMNHSDICKTSYAKKKGRESNSQVDSQALKVQNWLDFGACKWSATHCWKALDESYKSFSDLIPIEGLSKELCHRNVVKVQTRTILGLFLGSPKTKNHSNVGAAERRIEYYMGEGGGFPRVWAVVSLVSPKSPVACPSLKGGLESELTNLLVALMQVWVSK
jgi:hypothetical protein